MDSTVHPCRKEFIIPCLVGHRMFRWIPSKKMLHALPKRGWKWLPRSIFWLFRRKKIFIFLQIQVTKHVLGLHHLSKLYLISELMQGHVFKFLKNADDVIACISINTIKKNSPSLNQWHHKHRNSPTDFKVSDI